MGKNFKLSTFLFALFLLCVKTAQTQQAPPGRPQGNMNVGHFYGKVLDAKTNKPIELATVQLKGNRFDTATKKMKAGTIKTTLSEANGDFSLENLPVFGNFTLKISAVGYKPDSQQVRFGLKYQNNNNNNNTNQQ